MTIGITFKRALLDFQQHFISHTMTTLVVGLSCLIFVFFSLFSFNLEKTAEKFGRELAVVVYLKRDVPQDRVPALYQKIAGMDGIESVKFVSSEEAFKRLEEYFKNEREVLESVDSMFLPPSFEIQINRAVYHIDRIKRIAERLSKWPEIAKVQYGQEWVDRLEAFSRLIREAVMASAIVLLVTAAFVVSNTIKLTVYSRQEEIEIMRLVGATNGFIQAPFLLSAFFQGAIGSSMAILISLLAYRYISNILGHADLLKNIGLQFLPFGYILLFIMASATFCVIGTAMALRRFLKL